MPVDKVAEAVNQAITNFIATNPTYLKQIEVIVFEQRMVADFQNALTVSAPSTSHLPQTTSSQNGITVNVTGGDILISNCEVMINTVNKEFKFTSK